VRTSPTLAVVICTHNPRPAYIAETLDGLRTQTLPVDRWDLVLIDNASQPPLAAFCNPSWHPRTRLVTEERLGIAPARHRALRETLGYDLVLFVDDDNVLDPGYLAEGLRLSGEWPQIGCWGGQLLPRFEAVPPAWAGNYLKYLAIWPMKEPMWGNCLHSYDLVPPTAGCFMRAVVRAQFLKLVETDPNHLHLGPRGDDRLGGEDMDMMLTAFDLGLGLGRFPSLRLEHIIPRERLTVDYMSRLVSGVACGQSLLEFIRYPRVPKAASVSWATIDGVVHNLRVRKLPPTLRRLHNAEISGHERARKIIKEWGRKRHKEALAASA
jgi:glycosyltransferase involved in cell wall biosynthesis